MLAAPIIAGTVAPAQAQTRVSADFRTALQPYGRWEPHARWGEVWIPSDRRRDWRPYTVGHWIYSGDWGWYWAEDQAEAAWGWVTYHYGRWVLDREFGWVWIPGDEWGPAFVEWRGCHDRDVDAMPWPPRGDCIVGWAPMPPAAVVAEYVDAPEFWTFVRIGDFATAPRLAAVILPFDESPVFLRETVLINRTVVLNERGRFAVNPGIPPGMVAAAIRRPLRTFDVRPRVLAGTSHIPGATVIRAQDLRNAGRGPAGLQANIRQSSNFVAPARRAPQLKALAAGERGRLGDNPPRAATGALQQQAQPSRQQQQQEQRQRQGLQQPAEPARQPQQQQQGLQPPSRPATQGQASPRAREELDSRAQAPAATPRDRAQTQGRAFDERRQQLDTQPRSARPQPRPQTEGRTAPTRREPPSGRTGMDAARGRIEAPRVRTTPERRMPSATEGRGGAAPPHIAPAAPHLAPAAPAMPHAARPAMPPAAPAAPPAHAAPPAAAAAPHGHHP
jgi:hypothetical protein